MAVECACRIGISCAVAAARDIDRSAVEVCLTVHTDAFSGGSGVYHLDASGIEGECGVHLDGRAIRGVAVGDYNAARGFHINASAVHGEVTRRLQRLALGAGHGDGDVGTVVDDNITGGFEALGIIRRYIGNDDGLAYGELVIAGIYGITGSATHVYSAIVQLNAIGVYAIRSGRRNLDGRAFTDFHRLGGSYSMLGCARGHQRSDTLNVHLARGKDSGIFFLAVRRCVRQRIGQRIGRSVSQNKGQFLLALYIECSSASALQGHAIECQFDGSGGIYFERCARAAKFEFEFVGAGRIDDDTAGIIIRNGHAFKSLGIGNLGGAVRGKGYYNLLRGIVGQGQRSRLILSHFCRTCAFGQYHRNGAVARRDTVHERTCHAAVMLARTIVKPHVRGHGQSREGCQRQRRSQSRLARLHFLLILRVCTPARTMYMPGVKEVISATPEGASNALRPQMS